MTQPTAETVTYTETVPPACSLALTRTVRNKKSVTLKKLEKRILRQTAKAIADFNMIESGDKVMVCMSGGKDSYVLLDTLMKLQKRAPIPFELVAVTINQGIPGFPRDTLKAWFEKVGVPYHIEDANTQAIVERVIPDGKNVCSLCARLRRGIIYRVAKELGCNKIALGHHMDDIVTTFLLNLFYGGRLKTMPPILRNDKGDNTIIRPLAYVRERDTEHMLRIHQYPVPGFNICEKGENLKRKEMKALVRQWDKTFDGRVYNIFMSLQRISPSHLLDPRLYNFKTFTYKAFEPNPTEEDDDV